MSTIPMTSALFLSSALAFIAPSAINFAQARTLPDRIGLKVATALATPRSPDLVLSSRSKESTGNYEKYLTSPPPTPGYDQGTMSSTPKPESPKGQIEIESPCSTEDSPCISDGCISMITAVARPIPSYPRPKPAPPKGQLEIESPCSTEESPCLSDGCMSMMTDFGRPVIGNPPPKPATPIVPILLRPKSPPRQYLVSARVDDLLMVKQVHAYAV